MTELNYRKDSKEQMPYEHYTEAFRQADPKEIGGRLQIPYDEEAKEFTLTFLGTTYKVSWPEYEVTHQENKSGYYPLEDMIYAKILVIRYLLEGKCVLSKGEFKTYREMPWGEVYYQQFNGRCILRLAYGFGNKQDDFRKVMEMLGGTKLSYGDISYEIELFEGFSLRFILWAGDDEFPPSSQILFSDNFSEAFSAEDMAVTGDVCIGTFKNLSKLSNE